MTFPRLAKFRAQFDALNNGLTDPLSCRFSARLLLAWAPVLAWAGFIFYFSAQPSFAGKGPDFETVFGICEFAARKGAHFLEYAVLMVWVQRALQCSSSKVKGRFLSGFLLVIAYAASDEWHQTFIFGRSGSVLDVFIDSLGAFSGGFFTLAFSKEDLGSFRSRLLFHAEVFKNRCS